MKITEVWKSLTTGCFSLLHQGIFFFPKMLCFTYQILPNSPLKDTENESVIHLKKVNLHLATPSKRDHTHSVHLQDNLLSYKAQLPPTLFVVQQLDSGGGAAAVS